LKKRLRGAAARGYSLIFDVLNFMDRLAEAPRPVLFAWMAGLAALTGLIWDARRGGAGWIAGGLLLAVSLGDWLSLEMLPRLERSFGPPMPPAFALSAVRALIMIVLALMWPAEIVALLLMLAITAVSVYAQWVEPFRIGVSGEMLRSPYLNAKGLRLLHIGDLHVERISPRERALNRLIRELSPDLILFSGDFVNLSYTLDPLSYTHIRKVVGEWEAPLGIYAVGGSPLVEPPDRVRAFVEGLNNVRLLEDEVVRLETPAGPVAVLGMWCTHNRAVDLPRLRALSEDMPPDALNILLYHSPDLAPEAGELGIDLYLAGHTHGGQLRLPGVGALLTSSELFKAYEMGRYAVNGSTLYVTRGLGMEGMSAPRFRFRCPPEITLWELQGS
jgi:hypothetical protein